MKSFYPSAKRKTAIDMLLDGSTKSEMMEVDISSDSPAAGKPIVELNFPRTAIIAMIARGDEYITPNGATILQPSDHLIILAQDTEGAEEAVRVLGVREGKT